VILVLTVTGLAAPSPCSGCTTPVFQFALENWPPDPYRLEIVLPSSPGGEVQRLVERLEAASTTNLLIRQTEGQGQARVSLRYPAGGPTEVVLWEEPLTADAVDALCAGPTADQVAELLASGESAVWLLLPGTDARENARCRELLDQTLERFAEEANRRLAEMPVLAPPEVVDPTPVTISFAVLEVDRNSRADRVLAAALLEAESDLRELEASPLLFPVFGRGRAIWPLVGGGINERNLNELAFFVTGACSCDVKAQSPGVDLLLSYDWDSLGQTTVYSEELLPPLTTVSLAPPGTDPTAASPAETSDPEFVAAEADEDACLATPLLAPLQRRQEETTAARRSLTLRIGLVLGPMAGLAVVVLVLLMRKSAL
jgi:hypothetical protein